MAAPIATASGAYGDEGAAGVVIAPADCAAMVAHVPDASVDHVPGVDARGRPVAPADLRGHEPLTITAAEIGIDPRLPLSAFVEPPAAPLLERAEIELGPITVRDGVAYLGGRALGRPQQAAIARACAQHLR